MNFDHNHYVPCLPWKQGEYLAISGLSKTAKSFITPLIEVPEIGFDFETRSASKEIDEHLAPFAKRVHDKWGDSPCFVDLVRLPPEKTMEDGSHPISYVFDRLRKKGCAAVPVTGLVRDRRFQAAVKQVLSKDKLGLGLRIGIGEAAGAKVRDEIEKLLTAFGLKPETCDLIVDIGAPNFEPVEGFAKLIESLLRRLPHLPRWRTYTLVGTGFPSTMAEIKKSVEYIKRWEWIAYKKLVNSIHGSLRVPTFGDFAINHPKSISVDMRLVKPSATIRYTVEDGWLIVKGPNVRDHGFDQFRLHSRTVLKSNSFMGSSFSQGDKFIEACAAGSGGPGNLTTWRKVGTSHHIERVVLDISRLFGSSNAA